jgi:hypothetical protein
MYTLLEFYFKKSLAFLGLAMTFAVALMLGIIFKLSRAELLSRLCAVTLQPACVQSMEVEATWTGR